MARLRRGAFAAAMALAAAAAPARAHPLAPSLLELRERADGHVDALFRTPWLQPDGVEIRPELPVRCREVGTRALAREGTSAALRFEADCGRLGLVGAELAVTGLVRSRTDALVRVELADGRRLQRVLSAGRPRWRVPAREARLAVLGDYAALGFRHIGSGPDHLLFLLGLVLLAGGGRALLWTITAFTAGHSLTLAAATLGLVHAPTRLIELAIAASVLVLALELVRDPPQPASLLRRRPALLAFAFGLLHGMGFAGALAETGLPVGEIPSALFAFNVGIEAGQLVFVAALLAARRALHGLLVRAPRWLELVPAYGIGTLAAYWCISRTAGLP